MNRANAPYLDPIASASTLAASDSCVPDLLLGQALAQPDHLAVVSDDERLSYRELVTRSRELARYLRHLGVSAGDCVGVFVEPSVDLMVGVWGILLAGSAYLPLSPAYPEERLRYMIADSPATVVVTQDGLRARAAELAPPGTTIVTVGDAAAFAASRPAEPDPAGPAPENLAYVIYTSGSTGKPKGVMIEHRSIVSQLRWLAAAYGIDRDRVVLQKTPMSFDAAQWEILAPACGSTVVMAGPDVYRDPERLVDTIVRHGVTTLQCVPTLLQALLDTERLPRCTSLRQVFSGGEALSRSLAMQCLDALPGCELVNLYGPTECTINSSAFTVDRATVADGPQTVSIGAPVHGTSYYILDGDRAPVAVGEIGELYVGGVQLARGYLHRPDLTADRFVDNPFSTNDRLYRTGDLAYWNADGTVQYVGRTDNQVKLRGFRVELDEIGRAIEGHDWVKNAAVVVKRDPRTGFQNLVAFVELNPKEAALMDQGNHGAHHQSKESRLQIRAQLSNPGCRDDADLAGRPVVDLPASRPTRRQRRQVFARKTYRFFEGGEVTSADLLRLLADRARSVQPGARRTPDTLSRSELGRLLRYFGQFVSAERLLPKYGYASPGALYATQLYLELDGIAGLAPGLHYYHPVHHRLVLIRSLVPSGKPRMRLHFVGKRSAIEPVYTTNLHEVLEIEAGHMVGLFEQVLPRYGLDVAAAEHAPATMELLECAPDDHYVGSFDVVPHPGERPPDPLDVYVQAHPGRIADLPAGQYRYTGGELVRIGDDLVQQRHVIAINQQVYSRASFGISLVHRAGQDWRGYLDLGRALHRLQSNDLGLGFMASGYSSRTGHDLPSARRLQAILDERGLPGGPSYFFVGGRVSDQQRRSVGMKEDAVHMQGPTELIRSDLINFLPDYMMPNKVVVLDRLPLTVNGKIDSRALEAMDVASLDRGERPFVAPRTGTEERVAEVWRQAMKCDAVSVHDDFFECGGNSLIAVGLVNTLNRRFGGSLPLQVLFDAPTVATLAKRLDGGGAPGSSRAVPLRPAGVRGTEPPVYCWPGLGGYVMNLRALAARVGDRGFYGVQAHGINPDEVPYASIREMAAADVELIRRLQPRGPYTLWGYSFGARVAFEAAYQLEQAGEQVSDLVLIAPGSPRIGAGQPAGNGRKPDYTDRSFLTILFSVFGGCVTGPLLAECLRQVHDEASFATFVGNRFDNLDPELVRRIVRIVERTYQFDYDFRELAERRIAARVTVLKASGDGCSFLEDAAVRATVVQLRADHYGVLKEPGVDELVSVIGHIGRTGR